MAEETSEYIAYSKNRVRDDIRKLQELVAQLRPDASAVENIPTLREVGSEVLGLLDHLALRRDRAISQPATDALVGLAVDFTFALQLLADSRPNHLQGCGRKWPTFPILFRAYPPERPRNGPEVVRVAPENVEFLKLVQLGKAFIPSVKFRPKARTGCCQEIAEWFMRCGFRYRQGGSFTPTLAVLLVMDASETLRPFRDVIAAKLPDPWRNPDRVLQPQQEDLLRLPDPSPSKGTISQWQDWVKNVFDSIFEELSASEKSKLFPSEEKTARERSVKSVKRGYGAVYLADVIHTNLRNSVRNHFESLPAPEVEN